MDGVGYGLLPQFAEAIGREWFSQSRGELVGNDLCLVTRPIETPVHNQASALSEGVEECSYSQGRASNEDWLLFANQLTGQPDCSDGVDDGENPDDNDVPQTTRN
jgi:hypothetical protein